MANSGTSTTTTVSAATPVMAWSTTRRHRVMGGILMCGPKTAAALEFVSDISSSYASRRLPTLHAPHHDPCQRVDASGDKEAIEADLDHSRKIQIAGRFGELV